MANTKISALSAASALAGTEVLPVVQSAATVGATVDQIRTYIGAVTATGGSLTSNAVVLGAGTTDTKVSTGITTDGAGQLVLGVAGSVVGSVAVKNATSGTITVSPPTGALGTVAITWPAATGTLAVLGANTFTALQSVSMAVDATSTDGLALATTTAATVGAQKYSPRIRWTGSGWKTNATAAAQAVDGAVELIPVQGAAAPTAKLSFSFQINGGGYSEKASVNSNGTVTGHSGSTTVPGIALDDSSGMGLSYMSAIGGMGFTDQGFTRASVSGVNGVFGVYSNGAFSFGSGSGPANSFDSGFHRGAAGQVNVTDGSSSTAYRDLKLRTLIPGGTLATDMTAGFYNIPGAAGAPSGVPANTTGFPMYFDSTNNKIYVYDGGWLSTAALT